MYIHKKTWIWKKINMHTFSAFIQYLQTRISKIGEEHFLEISSEIYIYFFFPLDFGIWIISLADKSKCLILMLVYQPVNHALYENSLLIQHTYAYDVWKVLFSTCFYCTHEYNIGAWLLVVNLAGWQNIVNLYRL